MSPSTALPFDAIPGPTMLENLVRYTRGGLKDYHVFLEKNFKRYGPIFKYVMPGVDVVHICDPDTYIYIHTKLYLLTLAPTAISRLISMGGVKYTINYLQKIRKYKKKIKVRLHYWKT